MTGAAVPLWGRRGGTLRACSGPRAFLRAIREASASVPATCTRNIGRCAQAIDRPATDNKTVACHFMRLAGMGEGHGRACSRACVSALLFSSLAFLRHGNATAGGTCPRDHARHNAPTTIRRRIPKLA
jgi:hypothetical protein